MDFDSLSTVQYGDRDGLSVFLFENSLQHRLFRDTFLDQGISVPAFPLSDVEIENIDDWLLAHQVEHQAFASLLGLSNPYNMLDADWSKEGDFYDWLGTHLTIHQQIAASLGLT